MAYTTSFQQYILSFKALPILSRLFEKYRFFKFPSVNVPENIYIFQFILFFKKNIFYFLRIPLLDILNFTCIFLFPSSLL